MLVLGGSLLVGCISQEDLETESASVTGDWKGGVRGLSFELSLFELDGGAVTGDGKIRGAGGTVDVAVQMGKHNHPRITLTLAAPGFDPLSLTGAFETEDEIRGVASGSGLNAEPFTLLRQ